MQECGSARMTGALPHIPELLTGCAVHLCLFATPNLHPLQGGTFQIPVLTCQLPPLISAFFSSRSESLSSLWSGWSVVHNRNLDHVFKSAHIASHVCQNYKLYVRHQCK